MRFIFLIGLIFLNPASTNAQLESMSAEQFRVAPSKEISLSPSLPEPGETVTASLKSNISEGEIVWLLNGTEIDNTRNYREIDFVVSETGETDLLRVVVSNQGVVLDSLEKTITPKHVDIILEPQTYSPDFYLGRTLPSPGSLVNATVLISGINDYSNLLFEWRLDQDIIGNGRSLGRNVISFETGRRPNPTLSIEITDQNGNTIAEDRVIVPNELPYVKFYQADTLLGLSTLPIKSSWSMTSNTGILRAVPYNLDSRVYNNPDIIEWEIDGDQFSNTGSNPYEIILQKNNSSGQTQSRLDFQVRDTDKLIQSGKANININL